MEQVDPSRVLILSKQIKRRPVRGTTRRQPRQMLRKSSIEDGDYGGSVWFE